MMPSLTSEPKNVEIFGVYEIIVSWFSGVDQAPHLLTKTSDLLCAILNFWWPILHLKLEEVELSNVDD